MSFASGSNRLSTVPFGNLSKAALVGANTVNGPSLLSVSTKPAALTAATNVLKSLFPAATPTIVSSSPPFPPFAKTEVPYAKGDNAKFAKATFVKTMFAKAKLAKAKFAEAKLLKLTLLKLHC